MVVYSSIQEIASLCSPCELGTVFVSVKAWAQAKTAVACWIMCPMGDLGPQLLVILLCWIRVLEPAPVRGYIGAPLYLPGALQWQLTLTQPPDSYQPVILADTPVCFMKLWIWNLWLCSLKAPIPQVLRNMCETEVFNTFTCPTTVNQINSASFKLPLTPIQLNNLITKIASAISGLS